MIHELYISRTRRDARFKELRATGHNVYRRSLRNPRLHPEYITDANEEGITYQSGLGNTDYLRSWAVLYSVEGR